MTLNDMKCPRCKTNHSISQHNITENGKEKAVFICNECGYQLKMTKEELMMCLWFIADGIGRVKMMPEEIKKCVEAQKQYCIDNGLPVFISLDGRCYRCGHQIFGADGISLKGAGNFHITGCPICHYSFCE